MLRSSLLLPALACGVTDSEDRRSPAPVTGALPGPGPRASNAPRVTVLGTAQDAGVPQVNCFTGHCAAVRSGDAPPPRVASLGIVDTVAGRRFLVDATPDFVAQLGDLLAIPVAGEEGDEAGSQEQVRAAPRPGLSGVVRLEEHLHGVLLTHAHIGHYTGLIHCGREGAATRELPVYTSRSMAAYLDANEPFSSLVRGDYVRLVEVEPGQTVTLTPQLTFTPLAVVHRAELTDTLGFLFAGPNLRLLYVPDADRWEGWPVPFEAWLDEADVAMIDGSFYSGEELGHRPQAEVPHPPVSSTVELLAARTRRPEVWFIHLNHTNPLWDPGSAERSAVEAAGFGVATTGQRLTL